MDDLFFLWFAKRWREMQALFEGVDCSHIRITCDEKDLRKRKERK